MLISWLKLAKTKARVRVSQRSSRVFLEMGSVVLSLTYRKSNTNCFDVVLRLNYLKHNTPRTAVIGSEFYISRRISANEINFNKVFPLQT